jgi:hypothetical protein
MVFRTMSSAKPNLLSWQALTRTVRNSDVRTACETYTEFVHQHLAITVSNVCYLLCQYPEYQKKLFDELRALTTLNGIVDDQHLVGKPYLTGIINEALRLHPPVPSGLQRLTPPEGAVIAGRYIPGDMNVTTPTYSLHRGKSRPLRTNRLILTLVPEDARAFARPNEFIPERWFSQPELVSRRDAFVPLGYGAYNCAGRPLAMLQLRMVVAMIFKRFEVSFAPGREAECQHFIDHQADCVRNPNVRTPCETYTDFVHQHLVHPAPGTTSATAG